MLTDADSRTIEYFNNGAVFYSHKELFSEDNEDILGIRGNSNDAKDKYSKKAKNFLEENDLFSEGMYYKDVSFAKVEKYDVASKQIVEKKTVCASVQFGYKIDGIDTWGPGAKVNVFFKDDKTISGYYSGLSKLKFKKQVKVKNPKDVVNKYMKYKEPKSILRAHTGVVDHILIDNVDLVYYLYSANKLQDKVQPAYLISGRFIGKDNNDKEINTKFEWLEKAVN